eukprot:3446729-Pyramimonas_sp.AAC.1
MSTGSPLGVFPCRVSIAVPPDEAPRSSRRPLLPLGLLFSPFLRTWSVPRFFGVPSGIDMSWLSGELQMDRAPSWPAEGLASSSSSHELEFTTQACSTSSDSGLRG